MKLQNLAIIFVVIIIPISFILTEYIQSQIDTIVLQTAYQSNLNNATYDALKAFQINSVNNTYTSVSDSKIRDVEAAISTFYNSLGVSMDSYINSYDTLRDYIPAVLFTMYDGYYIYSSYEDVYNVNEDGMVDIENKTKDYNIGLKPYIYYSAEYSLGGNNIVINYSLDNFITVYGDFGSGYETKSGYFIDTTSIDIARDNSYVMYNGVKIEPESLMEELYILKSDGTLELGDYNYVYYQNKKVYLDKTTNRYFWYDNYEKTYLQSELTKFNEYLNSNIYLAGQSNKFQSTSAMQYYIEAAEFSEWVESNLGSLRQSELINIQTGNEVGNDLEYLSYNTTERIFRISDENDPMLEDSIFNNHRNAIIRKSIETNMANAISNYNEQYGMIAYEFVMPVLDEVSWYKLSNNVAIATFMQGQPMGYKYFNNYSVATNTKNEEVINSQSLYVVTESNTAREYHQPGCGLLGNNDFLSDNVITQTYTDISFLRQTITLNDTNNYYFYPQKRLNKYITSCYTCIVNSRLQYTLDEVITGDVTSGYYSDNNFIKYSSISDDLRKSYLTGLARERYDLYKSNNDLNL